ncbi:uncharacterized protein [Salminus brasiliensis]|uniref:uncharacterized protein isoform X2 n=1 Tax=Salminus brasiliensis TaxID=930266 RepID=UPI003B83253A
MATGLDWMSDSPSSLEITIISILFIVVYITLYTLCTNCFSQSPETPHYPVEKENPSFFSPKEKPEDQWSTNRTVCNEHVLNSQRSAPQVPDRPPTRSCTVVQTQLPKVHCHNRAESHGYFSQGMMPQLPDAPVFSVGTAGSVFPRIPDSPLFISTFHRPRALEEPAIQPPSLQQPRTVLEDHETLDKEPNTNTVPWLKVSEEHLYESISVWRVNEPSLCREAAEDQLDSESLYETVREPEDPAADHPSTSFTVRESGLAENPGLLFQPFPAVQDSQGLVGTEITVVYAAVNLKKKSLKLKEFPLSPDPIVQDRDDIHEEAAPPVPEKMFE